MGLAIESSVTYSEIRQTVYFSLLGWRKPARSAGDWTAGLLRPGRLLHRPLRRWRGGRHWCSRRRRRIWSTASDGHVEEKQRRYLAFGIEQSYPSAAEGQIRRRCRRHRSRQVEKDEQRARQARVRAFFDLELNTLSYRAAHCKDEATFFRWFVHSVSHKVQLVRALCTVCHIDVQYVKFSCFFAHWCSLFNICHIVQIVRALCNICHILWFVRARKLCTSIHHVCILWSCFAHYVNSFTCFAHYPYALCTVMHILELFRALCK